MTRDGSLDLFGDLARERSAMPIDAGAVLLVAHAQQRGRALLDAALAVLRAAPARRMPTRSGGRMSVAMSNCGAQGWVSDRLGYRYDPIDPDSGRPWPAMPGDFLALAREAAQGAGYPNFVPDVCLINRYQPGDRLGLHQDMDEGERESPIVSVSLGLGALFLWGGKLRRDPTRRIPLAHGDVMVWGGPTRLNFHGVHSIAEGHHPLTGAYRYNLTFRRCGTRAA
jgi:DNA oxidative demethylase